MTRTARDHHILVLGGGYTGMTAALRAAGRTRRHGGRVTLVNPSTRFVERLRMHQIATGQRLADHQIPDLLEGSGVAFVQGRATGIDLDGQTVTVDTPDGPRALAYDTLVYALGSFTDTSTVPGAAEVAHTLNGPDAARALATRLAELPAGATVAVCGGGLTGVEAATEIAESHPDLRVTLLSRGVPGPRMNPKAHRYLMNALARLGVEVRTGVEITKVLSDGVEVDGGEPVPADLTVWTTGFRAAPLAARAGLAVDDAGRIVVDPTLRSVSHPSVYAVGDSAAIPQKYGVMHGTCQGGIPSAAGAADAIARRLRGKEAKPFRFGYIHQPVSLGRRDAVIQFTYPDDSPRRWKLTGRRAVIYKDLVSSSPVPSFKLMRRMPRILVWTHGGRATKGAVATTA
ncbi:MAG: NAD(P)/FAD-dependent oxidoreductase [Mycobacteriales bacterium]